MATLRRTCAPVPQPSELRSGVVRAKRRGSFGRFLFPIFTMGNAISSLTVKCFRFICENLTFPFGKHVGKPDSWAFWRYIHCQDQRWGLWEISEKVTIGLRKFRPMHQSCRRNMHIHEWTPRRSGPSRTARTAFRLRMLATARRDAALFPNYFGQTCCNMVVWFWWDSSLISTTNWCFDTDGLVIWSVKIIPKWPIMCRVGR